MTRSRSTDSGRKDLSGSWALATTLITLLVVLVSVLMLQPKLAQRRLNIDDVDVLTADEVADLPDGTLAVVLDRRPGQDASDFRYRLLKLVMERSGQPYVLGLSAAVQPQDEAIAALAAGRKEVARNPYQLSVGVYGAGHALNQRLRPIEIPVTGGLLAGPIRPLCPISTRFITSMICVVSRFCRGWAGVMLMCLMRLGCAPTQRVQKIFSDLLITTAFSCSPGAYRNWRPNRFSFNALLQKR